MRLYARLILVCHNVLPCLSRDLVEQAALEGAGAQADMMRAVGHIHIQDAVARIAVKACDDRPHATAKFPKLVSDLYDRNRHEPGAGIRLYFISVSRTARSIGT
jgi:hypothetical protein